MFHSDMRVRMDEISIPFGHVYVWRMFKLIGQECVTWKKNMKIVSAECWPKGNCVVLLAFEEVKLFTRSWGQNDVASNIAKLKVTLLRRYCVTQKAANSNSLKRYYVPSGKSDWPQKECLLPGDRAFKFRSGLIDGWGCRRYTRSGR